MSIRTAIYTLVSASVTIGSPLYVSADVIHLTNGGRIEGKLLNKDQSPRTTYVIQTSKGGRITLAAGQVKKVIGRDDSKLAYQMRLKTQPDTAQGHWETAQWCAKNKLLKEQTFHLEKTIEHDPDHREARRELGFTEQDGRWLTKEQLKEHQGFIKYKGKWRLPEDVEREKALAKINKTKIEWKKKLRIWRKWLDSERRSEAGLNNIKSIDDPLAAEALAYMLSNDYVPKARLLYVDILSRLNSPVVDEALVLSAMGDEDETVRDNCLTALKKRKSKYAVGALVGYLRNKDNQVINEAARGLHIIADPAATLPLINALVTTHRYVQQTGQPGGIGASFGSGGTGLSSGSKTITYTKQFENQDVLDALLELTKDEKVNFRFDQYRWKQWYGRRGIPREVNLRRDN